MNVGLYFDEQIPVRKYGGIERVVVWLARGLAQLGHSPVLLARPGSSVPPYRVHQIPTRTLKRMRRDPSLDLDPYLPKDLDVIHFHAPVRGRTEVPCITTIHGNGVPGSFGADNVFVSKDHMQRMLGRHFVLNGVDPDEFRFNAEKSEDLLFLGLASRSVKGVDRAIRVARAADRRLRIAGGRRLSLDRRIRWEGLVDDRRKRELLASCCALVNPIRWEEPFGLVVVEALASGTPVLASPRGAMPELVSPDTGALCEDEAAFVEAIGRIGSWSAEACRQRVLDHFTHRRMAEDYLRLYRRAISGTLAD